MGGVSSKTLNYSIWLAIPLINIPLVTHFQVLSLATLTVFFFIKGKASAHVFLQFSLNLLTQNRHY